MDATSDMIWKYSTSTAPHRHLSNVAIDMNRYPTRWLCRAGILQRLTSQFCGTVSLKRGRSGAHSSIIGTRGSDACVCLKGYTIPGHDERASWLSRSRAGQSGFVRDLAETPWLDAELLFTTGDGSPPYILDSTPLHGAVNVDTDSVFIANDCRPFKSGFVGRGLL